MCYHLNFLSMLRVLIIKFREENNMKPVTLKHVSKIARGHLNLIYFRRYGELFDPKDLPDYKPKAPNYKKRASRRKGECTTHSGSCFMNPRCAFWANQLQCGIGCPKKLKCFNRFIEIKNEAFKGIQLYLCCCYINNMIVGLTITPQTDKINKTKFLTLKNETNPDEYLAILPCLRCDSSVVQRVIVDLFDDALPTVKGSF